MGIAVFYWFGSLSLAQAYFDGYSVVAEQAVVSVGEVDGGKTLEATFELRNLTGTPATILGVATDCGCVAADELPLVIPPRSSADLRIRYSTRQAERSLPFSHTVLLCMDVDNPPVVLKINGLVLPSSSTTQRVLRDISVPD